MVEFGVLEDAPLREAWPHEAQSFTPWLAANLDRLGREIGLALELEGIEKAVGPYSADILAIDPRSGARVLIENQLEEGDHKHLGQIMTYLTGLDAKTVIWVAQRFRPEHLSALRWLNEHTSSDFNFFAVRLRVVRIGASPYAPLFEVLERPNDWDRRLQTIARETSEASPITAFRRDFWARLRERHPDSAFTSGSASSQWRSVGMTDIIVSAYLAQDRVGVFLRGGRGISGETIMPLLRPYADRLTEALGAPIGDPAFPFTKAFAADMTAPGNWDAAADWLISAADRYARVVEEMMGQDLDG